MGIVGAIGDLIESGKVKLFSCNTNSRDSLYDKAAHPFHRSWMLRMFDEYVSRSWCPSCGRTARPSGLGIGVAGMSLGAFYAINAMLKHPDVFKRCYAISGLYDMKRFMDGQHDENFYFNNPVDYLPGLTMDGTGSTTARATSAW